jgi:hypothetical protein
MGNSASTSRPEPARNRREPGRSSFGLRDQACACNSVRIVSTRLYLTDISASLNSVVDSGYTQRDHVSTVVYLRPLETEFRRAFVF